MPVSTQSLRRNRNTTHGFASTFGGLSSPSTSTSSNILINLGGLMHKHPPGLNLGPWSTHKRHGSGERSRPSIRLPYTTRRVPPPPPPKVSTLYSSGEDPFSDSQSFDPIRTVIYDSNPSSRSRRGSTSSVQLYAIDTDVPTQVALAPDREARSKLVAGILLHRVHAVGKPMRKVPLTREGPREYVRSGLSVMITMDR